ncbi:hypothetical protein [Parasitella parasitica]|uniref:Uncharacterized protein n=1 Tax=Parasitella parasitica TaxID=35722 RepID=A0A0B7N7W8_9FUNG|nr:hypothetical protein [Parasitella parasitica]
MKFSLTAASIFAFACLSSVKADSYSDAIKEFCDGLQVTAPSGSEVFVAGQNATVTVTRTPNSHEKVISGLDLYSVDSNNNPKYIQNTWYGRYNLNTQASISDEIPADAAAGQYMYRVWVTNLINGQHGPDCIKTSRTFKVTTGSHVNDAGFVSYAQALDDVTIFRPEVAKGCFGLTVKSPIEGSTHKQGEFITIELKRDSASQTDLLTKIELYKAVDGVNDDLVETVWNGNERLANIFSYKQHLNNPGLDTNASYYYKIGVTSEHGETCSFKSDAFKVTA